MSSVWRISPALDVQVRHLPPDLKRQVRGVLDLIEKTPEAGKALEDELEGFRSFRIGRYRLIYKIQGDHLILKAFGSRRDIYERMILEIGRLKIRERAARYGVPAPQRPSLRASKKGVRKGPKAAQKGRF